MRDPWRDSEILVVFGSMNIRKWSGKNLPKTTRVMGDMRIEDASALSELPEGMDIRGGLDIYRACSVERLPDDISVGGLVRID